MQTLLLLTIGCFLCHQTASSESPPLKTQLAIQVDITTNERELYVWKKEHRATKFTYSQDANSVAIVKSTDGKVLFEGVYRDERLTDCEVSHSLEDLEKFAEHFRTGSTAHKHTLIPVSAAENGLLQVKSLVAECKQLHRHQMQHLKSVRRHEKQEHKRAKRGLADYFMWPGTKWCGRGSVATHVKDMGVSTATDKCCMEHDGCPYLIEGLSTRFNYFNFKLHTLLYCDCEERFYRCLMEANTSSSKSLWKWYILISPQCFDLERERGCIEDGWWGCKRQGMQLVAKVRNTIQ